MPATETDTAQGMLRDLRHDLLHWLPLPTAVAPVYLVVFAIHVAESVPWPTIIIAAWVVACALLAHRLKLRHQRTAALLYVAGLVAATLALAAQTHFETVIMLFPAVILLSIAMVGVRLMVSVTALGAVAILVSAGLARQLDYLVLARIAIICLTAITAWLSHRHLLIVVEWAWTSYQQARSATEEARERRGELARTLRALDEAYYRLERYSAQLVQAREAADEARRAKQEFVATVSHELRTPLNIIVGFAELMIFSPETYGVRGVRRQFLGDVSRIYRSAQHLKGLIDDVLDLSQIDARHMVLLTEKIPLSEVIAEATDMVWGLASKKGLQLTTDLPAELPAISLDRLRVRQVLLNLLSNAVRFTDRGRITVSAHLAGKEIRVTVSDTGSGIAQGDLERVFEEFRQLDSGLNRRYEGTGLGLALSRRFVELHGGRMWAESELGRGSSFHFALPLVPVAGEITDTGPRPLPIPPGVRAQARRALLVATEEPSLVSLLTRHLQGYAVQGVPARELPAAIAGAPPHAVIRNGLVSSSAVDSATAALAPDPALPATVVTCPLPDPSLVSRQLGVDHYLIKPISRERLLAVLAGYGEAVRRVLIVDDDAQLAELLARMVQAAPQAYEVDTAFCGKEGWSLMQERPPDLVLLDQVMEDLDGLAILQLMRADARLRRVPVAVITARDLPVDETLLPGRGRIWVDRPESFTVAEALRCLQSLLDALPPAPPASSPPPRPRGAVSAPQAS